MRRISSLSLLTGAAPADAGAPRTNRPEALYGFVFPPRSFLRGGFVVPAASWRDNKEPKKNV